MIEIDKLISDDLNRLVIYTPNFGEIEQGRITSWNDEYIFVDYSNCGRGSATKPEYLKFI